ncbi:hypothetical protein GCM10022257_10940 [Hyunsoonleella aestuarii]|uniref:Secretion system C-terminal sorting domain-containing protein n=2 Tax=Hyunsoonleella aestuarii TaxID=912802 RepID=A0ABP8E9S1_9FLAO
MPTYYGSIDLDQNGIDLEIDLSQLIRETHTTLLPYTSSQPDTWDAVKQTDLVPGDTENVLLFYGYDDFDGNTETDYTRDKDLSCHTTSCSGLFNREHVYARSIANPSLTTEDPGSGTDAHNLRACDGDMNSNRSNRLFQDSNTSTNSHITASGNWYPGDEWKGDVARIVMYMFLRYPNQCPANDIGTGTNTNNTDMPDVFLQWNIEDPVSDYETQRNTVLESMQGNRNPFIDNPYLATKIWGGNPAEDKWGLLSVIGLNLNHVKIYPVPVSERLYITNTTSTFIDIAVYNVNGQKIRLPQTNNYLDVRKLKNGFYYLQVKEQEEVFTFKFIKN